MREPGFSVRGIASARDFLASGCVDEASCLILDITMPVMSGPALQRELQQRHKPVPIVFITAHADDTLRPRLL